MTRTNFPATETKRKRHKRVRSDSSYRDAPTKNGKDVETLRPCHPHGTDRSSTNTIQTSQKGTHVRAGIDRQIFYSRRLYNHQKKIPRHPIFIDRVRRATRPTNTTHKTRPECLFSNHTSSLVDPPQRRLYTLRQRRRQRVLQRLTQRALRDHAATLRRTRLPFSGGFPRALACSSLRAGQGCTNDDVKRWPCVLSGIVVLREPGGAAGLPGPTLPQETPGRTGIRETF